MDSIIKELKIDWTYQIHDAVMYENKMGRIEDRAVDPNDNEIYLIQLVNHHYHWVPVENLERYIG